MHFRKLETSHLSMKLRTSSVLVIITVQPQSSTTMTWLLSCSTHRKKASSNSSTRMVNHRCSLRELTKIFVQAEGFESKAKAVHINPLSFQSKVIHPIIIVDSQK